MNATLKRTTIALTATAIAAALGAGVTTAQASPATASAPVVVPLGGSGDFYRHRTCHPSESKDGKANLDVTNYDIRTGQRYHMDLDETTEFRVQGLYVDGHRLKNWNDVYWDDSDRGAVHEIMGVWRWGWFGPTVTCTKTL